MRLAKRFLVLCLLGELVACTGDGIDWRGDESEEDRAGEAEDRGGEPAAAAAGSTSIQPFLIPISIARQIDAPAPALRRLTVEASYDGGTVWKRALVLRLGDQAIALLHHPDGDGRVSLRAVAVDRDDNAVEQTIRDAYHLRAR